MDARPRQIRVLFENSDLIAVDKPHGLASIPERNPQAPSLLKLLAAQRGEKLLAVHRLDKQASGVMLFAKHADAHRHLNRLFAQRRVYKTYLALVHGAVEEARGAITMPLRPFGSGRMGAASSGGKACRTEFAVAARFPGYTLLRVEPLTGRKHQIRAHLYGRGHPIVGDRLYGDRRLQERFPRLMLHAASLRFRGRSGEEHYIESGAPDEFSRPPDRAA
ncbi:MAG: RluA family pseudouridine synthase [Desulfobacterales bacterium]|jgi:RluA family pseudouridine synthase|nr:RluA family pseudouridine synthase [Desulfobacterales bacterium]